MYFYLLIAEISDYDDLSSKLSKLNIHFQNQNQKVNYEYDPLNTSYKIVNEKVVKLKKLEFDYVNLCDVMKNYVIVQEILVNHLFIDQVDCLQEENIILNNDIKSKIEVIDKMVDIVNETLFYNKNELEEDSIIIRKIIYQFIKNQKQYLLFGIE